MAVPGSHQQLGNGAIVEQVSSLGYLPRDICANPTGKPGLASSRAWSARDADEVARRCVGAALIAMPRWDFKDRSRRVLLPTEFCHRHEGALARTLGLLTLVLVQQDVMRRVVFDPSFGYIGERPCPPPTAPGLAPGSSPYPSSTGRLRLADRQDGLSRLLPTVDGHGGESETPPSRSRRPGPGLADRLPRRRAPSLSRSRRRPLSCRAGIFLFTRDDDLADHGQPDMTAPRDNVVFEAGFFIGLKGKRNVLIVREAGSKMPADLGGDVYALLDDRANIGPIENAVSTFIGNL